MNRADRVDRADGMIRSGCRALHVRRSAAHLSAGNGTPSPRRGPGSPSVARGPHHRPEPPDREVRSSGYGRRRQMAADRRLPRCRRGCGAAGESGQELGHGGAEMPGGDGGCGGEGSPGSVLPMGSTASQVRTAARYVDESGSMRVPVRVGRDPAHGCRHRHEGTQHGHQPPEHSRASPARAAVRVSNSGLVILPDQVDGLLEPFRRLGRTGGPAIAALALASACRSWPRSPRPTTTLDHPSTSGEVLLRRPERRVTSPRHTSDEGGSSSGRWTPRGDEDVDTAPQRPDVPLVRRYHVDLCRTSTAVCPR
jgi:hypothetical protein